MIPKEFKRLTEVDLPITVVLKHLARVELIRYGESSVFVGAVSS